MNTFFKATDAKALATINAERIHEEQLQLTQDMIKRGSSEGRLSVVIDGYLSPEIYDILKESGYAVHAMSFIHPTYTISWK